VRRATNARPADTSTTRATDKCASLDQLVANVVGDDPLVMALADNLKTYIRRVELQEAVRFVITR